MGSDSPLKQTGYHGIPENQYNGNKSQWKTIEGQYKQTSDGRGEVLLIDGHPVMEQWEKPYMEALAGVATENGGTVLEVGFGLGLSASQIQTFKIDHHIIIEANADVVKRGKEWAKKQPHKVTFMHGLWQDEVAKLKPHTLDGVLYDTYPLSKEEQHIHQFDFIRKIFPALKPGGILTYCNLTSIGVLRGQYEWPKLWSHTQVPHLKSIGFNHMSYKTVPVNPPDACEYYEHGEALLPRCLKKKLNPAKFIKLAQLSMYARGSNIKAKIIQIMSPTPESKSQATFVKLADSTGFVVQRLLVDQIPFAKENLDKSIILRNIQIKDEEQMIILVDKWGKMEKCPEEIEDISSKNVGEIAYAKYTKN